MPPMVCLDDTQLVRLLDGALQPAAIAHIEAHLDGCGTCRALVADLAQARSFRSSNSDLSRSTPESADPEAPEPLGSHPPVQLTGRRYAVLDLIDAGGMGRVFRALDRLTRQHVALKALAHGAAQSGERLALAREFHTLASLRHPNIISVLDYGFDAAGLPYFTMELLHEARPLLPLAASAPHAVKLDLLNQLLRALRYLHRRGVLHRDLKPRNILVVSSPEGLALKVLDFGLALCRSEPGRKGESIAGTLAYIAPEILRGGQAGESADLYAVGVMAYEMLTGRHPFLRDEEAATLVRRVLYQPPDLEPIPAALRPLLARLLNKEPAERPLDAESLMWELAAAAGVTLPSEPAAVRDSHLVAARFLGRDSELQILDRALDDAENGRGSAWLVGGESGVGKSRLLEEQRSLALVRGLLVVRGQAVSGYGTAYHAWLDVLRVLVLHVDLSPLEASVLGTLLPELGQLIEREVLPPPELDAKGSQLRLLQILGSLLARWPGPLLIQMEDLQWADAESLDLLRQVVGPISTQRRLFIASYRDDEAPRLPEELPMLQRLPLGRLDRHTLEQLCTSMLGQADTEPQLLDLIERETDGNTYFVVEIIRSLAAAAGSLRALGKRELPSQVLAGGVEQVLQRQLLRVPDEALPFLRLAAIAGRQLDRALLARQHPQIDTWIARCADAGVLEVQDQRWRFRHDKLREHILVALSVSERRALHAIVAKTLEEIYPGSPLHTTLLAYHHREAQQLAQAASYYAQAGDAALLRGTPAEAVTLLEQALALRRDLPMTALESVQLWRGLALAWFGLGRMSETEAALARVFELSGVPLPTDRATLLCALARQVAEQLARRAGVLAHLPLPATSEEKQALLPELMLALGGADLNIWLGEPALSLLRTLWGLNLAEALDAGPQRTYFLASLAYFLSNTPLRALGVRYLKLAEPTIIAGTRAEIDYLRASAMISINEGRLGEAAVKVAQAIEQARSRSDEVALMYSLQQAQIVATGQDDYARLLDASVQMEQLALRTQSPRYAAFARIGQGVARLRRGEFALATAAVQSLRDEGGNVGAALARGVAVLAAHRQGLQLLPELVTAAMKAVNSSRWLIVQLRVPLSQILEVTLDVEDDTFRPITTDALDKLRRLARRYPNARANAFMYRARHAWHHGQRVRALLFLRRSLRVAERLGARYEQAHAHYWLGHFTQRLTLTSFWWHPAVALARFHLRTAHALFAQLGASWDAARAAEALELSMTGASPRS